MAYRNKGSMAATVTVSREPDRSGNWVCDGTADDVQIQAAIDYVNGLNGGNVLIKGGNYDVSAQINGRDYVSIYGVGNRRTTLTASFAGIVIRLDGATNGFLTLANFGINCNSTGTYGIYGDSVGNNVRLINLRILDATSRNIYFRDINYLSLYDVDSSGATLSGMRLEGCKQVSVFGTGSRFNANGAEGVRLVDSPSHHCEGIKFFGSNFQSNDSHGLLIEDDAHAIFVSGCWFENNAIGGVFDHIHIKDNVYGVQIVGTKFTDPGSTTRNCIYFATGVTYCQVLPNTYQLDVADIAIQVAAGANDIDVCQGRYTVASTFIGGGGDYRVTGSDFKNSGVATILNGTNSVVQAHGLIGTPTSINVTGTHAEVETAYVDTVGAANFTIHKGGVGNVTANRDVYWRAKYLP